MSDTLKALHDFMLTGKPEGASHDAATCPVCMLAGEVASATSPNGGTVADAKTYSEEEHAALLAQVEDLKSKVADLSKASADSELDSKIAAVKAELESKVTDLQSQLDASVLEAEAAKAAHAEIVASVEAEKTAAAEAVALAARKEERIAKVKEVASFPDEYLEANGERFAAMSDEAFTAALEDWKTIGVKPAKGEKNEKVPSETAMVASRGSNDNNTSSVLSEVLGLRFQGVDVRQI